MLDLSVIIVNYNVKNFLALCLDSVQKALKDISAEIYVIDNDSNDGSLEMVAKKFPLIKAINTGANLGFSKANNIALKQAKGRYVLLLNPDTVVQEDTFSKVIDFMDQNPQFGALGTKMIDGSGNYLPESKRGFPSISASLCKMLGTHKLFPNSKSLNKYYLGHLSADRMNSIDVLTGAFLLVRKEVLEQVGFLDEQFFMYGEDIDFSYRIKQQGHQIVYYPDSTIIHYKGESTKKSSLNYIKIFYGAMIIFLKKHFSNSSFFLVWFLKLSIYLKGGMSWVSRLVSKILHATTDFVLFGVSLLSINQLWATYYFKDPYYYDGTFTDYNILAYSGIWVFGLWLFGNYDAKTDGLKFFKGFAGSLILILILYSLLPEHLRSSRSLILFGGVAVGLIGVLTKYCFNFLSLKKWTLEKPSKKRILIAAQEYQNIFLGLEQIGLHSGIVGIISETKHKYIKTHPRQGDLQQIVLEYDINELIFSTVDYTYTEIIKCMTAMPSKLSFKMAGKDGVIVGSSDKNTSGEAYTYDYNMKILEPSVRRFRVLMNGLMTIIVLLLSPILALLGRNRIGGMAKIAKVVSGKLNWVGYDLEDDEISRLPNLKSGVFKTTDILDYAYLSKEKRHEANVRYARYYSTMLDLEILLKGLFKTNS